MANAFVEGHAAGTQVRRQRQEDQRNELFRESASKYIANPTNELAGQMFAQNPQMAGNALAARSQMDKVSQAGEQEQARAALYKMQMIRAAPPGRKLALYQQVSPEDYQMARQGLGRDPTDEEMDLFIDTHLPNVYAAAGVEPEFAGGGNDAVHSTFIGDNGNVWIVKKQGTKPVDTGIPATKFAPKTVATNAGVFFADPNKQTISSPVITEQQLTDAAANKEAATTTAATNAKLTTQAAFDLPRVEQNANQAIQVLTELENHPGLQYITGAYSLAPVVPGTEQAGADALALQIQGKTFLEAYQTLRGGGQITEIEGAKAEAAIARLSRKQKTEVYKQALRDLREVIQAGVQRARQQARAPQATQSAPINEPTATNPQTGEKIVFRNGQWQPM